MKVVVTHKDEKVSTVVGAALIETKETDKTKQSGIRVVLRSLKGSYMAGWTADPSSTEPDADIPRCTKVWWEDVKSLQVERQGPSLTSVSSYLEDVLGEL